MIACQRGEWGGEGEVERERRKEGRAASGRSMRRINEKVLETYGEEILLRNVACEVANIDATENANGLSP